MRYRMIAAAAGGVVLAAAGIAGTTGWGAAQATTVTGGTIRGCVYLHSNRTLERVFTNASKPLTCPRGTFLAKWDIQGPQGIPGIQGPKGDKGDTGPAGLAGVQADEPYGNGDPNKGIAQSDSTVPAGKTATIWAACPAGKVALGGGFRIGSQATQLESDSDNSGVTPNNEQVLASEPSYYDAASGQLKLAAATIVNPAVGSYQPNAWAVTVYNSGGADASARVAVVCAAEAAS